MDVHIINCRMSPRAALNEHILYQFVISFGRFLFGRKALAPLISKNGWLSSLQEAQLVGDIRGGDSFSDIYGLYRFLAGCLPSITAILMRKDLVLLPQTYGPFKSSISRIMARWILRHSGVIMARDRESIDVVREMIGKSAEPKLIFCPDVAFTLEPVKPAEVEIEPELDLDSRSRPLIGINVSGLLYMGGYTGKNMFALRSNYKDLVDQLIQRLHQETGADVLLVPHVIGSESELEALETIYSRARSRLGSRIHVLRGTYDQSQIKWIIGQCDFFIGSRMHACIAALSQGIPAVGLAYSRKFRGVFESVEAAELVLDLRAMTIEEVAAKTIQLFQDRNATAPRLRTSVSKARNSVEATFSELLAWGTRQ